MHDFKGKVRFEDFYLAQCVWEDLWPNPWQRIWAPTAWWSGGTATSSSNTESGARLQTQLSPYLTIYQASVGEEVDPSIADFIWFND